MPGVDTKAPGTAAPAPSAPKIPCRGDLRLHGRMLNKTSMWPVGATCGRPPEVGDKSRIFGIIPRSKTWPRGF